MAQRPAARPNFVVIYTDDQGIGDMGCYGAADVRTPYMDRLAASGVRFTDWYSNSPVCSPSRASVLTGRYPQKAGIPDVLTSRATFDVPGLRRGETTLPGELRRLGYRSACVGKWHLGSAPQSRPLAQGFDEFFGFYSGWIDGFSHRYYTSGASGDKGAGASIFHDLWRGEQEIWEDPAYHTEILTGEAKAFIARQTQPFCLYLAYGGPHFPMIAPGRYLERFPQSMDRDRRMHAAMLAAIDDGVGEILDLLRSRGIEENTAVFFQSDNGATRETRADHRGRPYQGGSNAHFRGYKGGLFEGGIRMPALLSWPGRLPRGKTISEVGMAMDILPTFLSWANPNGKPPAHVDGRDLTPMVVRGKNSPHPMVFWDYAGQSAVRRGDWKLMLNPKTGLGEPPLAPVWLSNLGEDPAETRNWVEGNTEVVRELRTRLLEWKASWAA
jgi:arylsulfatase A-like enzyme